MALCAVAILDAGTACRRRARPVAPTIGFHHEFTVPASRDTTFDAVLRVAHQLNLSVKVLEKTSGLLGFEDATLTASQLEQLCRYPFTRGRTDRPFDTFTGWNERSIADNKGPVTGVVAVNIMLTTVSPVSTNIDLRSSWVAGNFFERYNLASKDVLENELERVLRERLRLGSGRDEPEPFED